MSAPPHTHPWGSSGHQAEMPCTPNVQFIVVAGRVAASRAGPRRRRRVLGLLNDHRPKTIPVGRRP
eukprot:scaffold11884_cov106-Isochrysis_galbana.AAC.1